MIPDEVLELGDEGRSEVLTIDDVMGRSFDPRTGLELVGTIKPTAEGLEKSTASP
jgi:hypothetical protein